MIRMLSMLCFGLLLAVPAAAQPATVSGTVVDQTGGAVPGAMVRLTGPSGTSSTTSGPAGQYSFRNVTAGMTFFTLIGFMGLYLVLGILYLLLFARIVNEGPT